MIEYFIPQGSTYAGDIDGLIMLVFWLVGFWFILCELAFFYLIVKFRKKEGVKAEWVTGEEKSQKRWISWPHMLVLVCDVFIVVGAVSVWYDVKQNLPPAQDTVRVIAQQWAWTFVHSGPDGKIDTADDISTVNELHLEVDKLYHYKLESVDVLHNFSVPIFRLKQDAIPGRVITGWFQPTITGEYDIQCAEICGIGHGLMPGRVIIKTKEQQAAWVAEKSGASLASSSVPGPLLAAAASQSSQLAQAGAVQE